MGGKLRKSGKVNKGGPSGVIISLVFHGVVFAAAGLFVVFKVLESPKPAFVAKPAPQRPKMDLKKPQVKVRKSSSPKPDNRIVATMKDAKMPEISIPDLVGTGEGLLGGMGGTGGDGLGLIGSDTPLTVIGSPRTDGRDLMGTFYDFKRNSVGSDTDFILDDKSIWLETVRKFIDSGCNSNTLSKYYRSPKKLYAKSLVVSPTYSSIAPSAFDSDEAGAGFWMVHYQGKLVHRDGITFRFVCSADYFIIILVDDEVVWAGVWNAPASNRLLDLQQLTSYSPRFETRKYFIGNDRAMAGDWITLEPSEAKDIDIIIGDENGECGFIVAVEEEGVEYETGPQGGPIYPIFRTDVLTHDMVDQIFKDLPEGEVSVTNGPVFSDI